MKYHITRKEIKKVSLKSLHELVDYKKKVHENIKEIEEKYTSYVFEKALEKGII